MATASKHTKGPSPTAILLVRHGQTASTGAVLPGRAPGLDLTERGVQQAGAAASRLAALGSIDAVYSSPLERTKETAAIIARAVGRRVRTEPGLTECDFGSWTGRRLAELVKLPEWRTIQATPSAFRFPKGESFVEMQSRITAAIDRLVRRHPQGRIVVVSHADPIKAFVAHAAGTHLDHFQRIVISPCSITTILLDLERPVVLSINATGDDLAGLRPS